MNISLVVVIISVAIALSLISYQYSTTAAAQIVDIAAQEARSNAEIQAHDLSALLGKQIESVGNNLETMVSSRTIKSQEADDAIPLFNAAQKSTADITSSYGWLDKNGKLLWSSTFSNATIRQQFAGTDFSYREYYSEPRQTMSPYYSTLFEGLDGVPRLSISYPVIGTQTGDEASSAFNGVVVAGIEVETLGKFVQDQLVPSYKSSVGLMDRNGDILYSSASSQYIGKNIFGPEVQSVIPSDIKDPFNQFIRESLSGKTGSGDFTSQGKTSTIAYGPVTIRGNEFALMYIVTPHELAGSAVAFVEQQRTLNLVTVIGIGSVAAATSSVVLIWNRRLNDAVNAKTSELKFANESLTESNRQLQVANMKLGEANEQLLVHEKMQQEFVNVAAHELRTPVQPLLSVTELLHQNMNGKDKGEITRQDVEMLARNAKRLERLSSDILEVSRIESHSLRLKKEPVNLNEKIQNVIADVKSYIQKGQKIELVFQPNIAAPVMVKADKSRIFEVLSNLLRNALKFTHAGSILVTLEEKDGHAVVAIKDTGEGIDPEILPRLFSKFVTKSEQGTGLGLYLSKSIIEAHGGKIWAENNKDGKGATFSFTLPLEH
jgi:signal transduction histidine kinase